MGAAHGSNAERKDPVDVPGRAELIGPPDSSSTLDPPPNTRTDPTPSSPVHVTRPYHPVRRQMRGPASNPNAAPTAATCVPHHGQMSCEVITLSAAGQPGMTATGQIQQIYPSASAPRYARTCCARACPTCSRERIARTDGTRPAATSAANTPAARARSGSGPDTAWDARAAPDTPPTGCRVPRMIVMNSSYDPASATAGHPATAAPAGPWPRLSAARRTGMGR